MKKIKYQFKKLIDDISNKRMTRRVQLFIASMCAFILVAGIVVMAVIAGINNGKDSDSQVDFLVDAAGETSTDETPTPENESPQNSNDAEVTENTENAVAENVPYYVLEETADAGEEYINETLFIGDSNTVRMMNYGLTSLDNTIAVVGMGIQSVKKLQCVQFADKSAPVTMIDAVKIMQPRRIIITFGTNNANGMDADTFISNYEEALAEISNAYPYADILINAIPPIAKENKYPSLSQSNIDTFNERLREMAEKLQYKFIETDTVLKDPANGFAKEGYTISDGIHYSDSGFAAMFSYIRTHSHIVDDTRPKPLAVVSKQVVATYVVDAKGKMNKDETAYKQMSQVTKEEQEAMKKAQEEALKKAQEAMAAAASSSAKKVCKHPNYTMKVVQEATENSTGKVQYICNDCGYIYEETTPQKKPAQTQSSSSSATPVHQHSYSWVVTVPAGPGTAGQEEKRCSCGDVNERRVIPALPAASSSSETPLPVPEPTPQPETPSEPQTPEPTPEPVPEPAPEPEPAPQPEPEQPPAEEASE